MLWCSTGHELFLICDAYKCIANHRPDKAGANVQRFAQQWAWGSKRE